MNIGHFITSIDLKTGGPTVSVTNLCEQLSDLSQNVSIITFDHGNSIAKQKQFSFPISYLDFKEASAKRMNNVLALDKHIQLIHTHGIWEPFLHRVNRTARKKNVPYVISPRGMLSDWDLSRYSLKKKMALWLYQKRDLEQATVIHATSEQEANDIRKIGIKTKVVVVPNGINISLLPQKSFFESNKKQALLLSRLHPTKGVEYLIKAWHKLTEFHNDWQLEIVGNGEKTYIESLKKLVKDLQLLGSITISKPVFETEKVKKLHEADLFILPTHTENFGHAIAEALACSTPVITTKGTPWQEIETNKCGWWIDIGIEALYKTLKNEALPLSREQLFAKGKKGRLLIEEKYTMDKVAGKMLTLYKDILS